MKKNTPKQAGANPELSAALQGLRFSGAAGAHADRRTKRLRTRATTKARVMEEWL